MNMDKIEKYYDSESNIYWIKIKDGFEDRVEEITPGILVEFNSENEVIGFEISNASKYFETNITFRNLGDNNEVLPITTPVQPYIHSTINLQSASADQPVSPLVIL